MVSTITCRPFLYKLNYAISTIFYCRFSYQFSPEGRAGGFHMLRCQGFEVEHYDITLRRLANESLRLVLKSGQTCMKFDKNIKYIMV